MKNRIEQMENHYIICGGGRMAYTIGLELERSNKDFLFIENSPDSPVMENSHRWPIIQKNALLEDTLEEAGIHRAVGLAAVLQTDADNLFVVLSAKRLKPSLYIVTRIAFESTQSKMLQAGANKVVSPYTMGGMQIARSFISPEVNEFLEVVMDRASYEFEFQIHKITSDDSNLDKKIRDASFREEGFMVVSLRYPDGGLVFAPDADFVLQEGLEVLLLAGGEKVSGTGL
ncbi:MAG: NAD(P)-binding protein [Spirochaetota bacterium]